MGIQLKIIYRLVGFLFMAFSPILLTPILVSLWYQDGMASYFIISLIVQFTIGLLFWMPFRKQKQELRRREGFLIVVIFWVLLSVLGASIFVFALKLSYVDALFESVSGLTTTGATVLSGLDNLAPSILFYRQELQWFGGMGLIMLAVAIMPMLGIGGMMLYRAETPGPMKEEKLTPRLMHTAKYLWMLYVGLTLICAIAFWWAGMTPFDAISHSLSTLSTGGFSTHDASMGYFNSTSIDIIAIIFMLLGGINFSVHYLALHNRSLKYYISNTEVRVFLTFVGLMIFIVSLTLYLTNYDKSLFEEVKNASFEVVSIVTSTGYGVSDFSQWPLFLPVLMIFISFVGGCGGSTAGGMKVMRITLLSKLGWREIMQLLHTKAIFPIKFGGRHISQKTLQGIWGFFSIYIMTFVVLMLLMMMVSGQGQITSFSAVATCMNNLGPGLGAVTLTFNTLNDGGKLIAVIAMLLGRLEVVSVLVLLHPEFWRA
jgi:trk system potassium uptake protein TrkH